MDDLISRQAALNSLVTMVSEGLDWIPAYHIKELPSAQPEPKEGHWIWVAGELMCSECRTIYSDLYPDYDNAVACPHCGARMKGERQK